MESSPFLLAGIEALHEHCVGLNAFGCSISRPDMSQSCLLYTSEIERLLDCKVNLQLWVKVKKDWRDSDFLIQNFGYKNEEE